MLESSDGLPPAMLAGGPGLQVLIIHPCFWENRLPWRDVGREVGARCGESIHHLLLRIQTQGEIFIW